MQIRTKESKEYTEGDRENIRSPASEPVGREINILVDSRTPRIVCLSACVCKSPHLCVRAQACALQTYRAGPDATARATAGSAISSKTEGMRREKEEKGEWEKEDGGVDEEIPVPTERLWKHGERRLK